MVFVFAIFGFCSFIFFIFFFIQGNTNKPLRLLIFVFLPYYSTKMSTERYHIASKGWQLSCHQSREHHVSKTFFTRRSKVCGFIYNMYLPCVLIEMPSRKKLDTKLCVITKYVECIAQIHLLSVHNNLRCVARLYHFVYMPNIIQIAVLIK